MIPSRLALLGLMLVACSDSPSVQIVLPAEGEILEEGSSVMVTLEVSGLTIETAAGTTDPGTGHHHLIIGSTGSDPVLPVGGLPIPFFPGRVHLGEGQLEYEIEGLDAGEHVVIAVVGDGMHVPLYPWVVDTVRFVIE